MVEISEKEVTLREAVAEARISLQPKIIKLIEENKIPKGNVSVIAKCAGILAAKKVAELIPLCHPLPLEYVDIDFKKEKRGILITARCKTTSKTGVEMEALVACCIAALTVYDMCKSIDRSAIINQIKLVEKKGGRSGYYKRE
jgi:cyclic pyranopterin phosphate synthase